jgi:hypothetical protein
VPGVDAVAFNCAAPSAVPYVIAAGVAQLIVGVACFTAIETIVVAVV